MSSNYDESSVDVKSLMEGIRTSPGMYIGDSGDTGLHHTSYEIVHNSIDEASAGRASQVVYELSEDGMSIAIEDDGAGIPVGIHGESGVSTLEIVMTKLHAGAKFGGDGYKKSGGMHGVGMTVVNAFSEHFSATSYRDGKEWNIQFSRGEVTKKFHKVGPSTKRGTRIEFVPDYSIFKEARFDKEKICTVLDDLAYLNPNVTIIFKHGEEEKKFFHRDGVAGMVKKYTEKEPIMAQPIVISGNGAERDIDVSIAFNYVASSETTTVAYTNNIANPEGGKHVDGFRAAFTRAINKITDSRYKGEELRMGMVAVVSINMSERPELEGQTKSKLASKQVQAPVDTIVYNHLLSVLSENSKLVRFIVKRAKESASLKDSLAIVKEIKDETKMKFAHLTDKHTPPTNKRGKKNELFIVEGDSAGGSAKVGRDEATQGILPIRGKSVNTRQTALPKLLLNPEIRSIVTAIGAGILAEFEITKSNYEKVIVMTDADSDGAHIQVLLIDFFYLYMRPLVEAGMLYVAQPPLFEIAKGNKTVLCYTEEERDQVLLEMGPNAEIKRYKGLGEMDASRLWSTTMDPENRRLVQIVAEDAEACESMLDNLMGKDTEYRKELIAEAGVWA